MTSVSTIKSHRLDVPQQNDSNQEEVVDEQQLLNQERNFIVVQVGTDCSQMKEEQEDICISQEGEQFGLKQETQTFDEDSASTLTEPPSLGTSTPGFPACNVEHPAPEPSPAPSLCSTNPSTRSHTGKRKRSNPTAELATVFAVMQDAEREEHHERIQLQREQLALNSLQMQTKGGTKGGDGSKCCLS
ncbi:uncharacterized protein KZ484_017026 isoform 3-T3 [Pholidichthys leucotaenia]